MDARPDPRARFTIPEAPLSDTKLMNSLQKDLLDWAYRTSEVMVRGNEPLKLYAGPEITQAGFRQMCAEAAQDGRDAELDKVSAIFDKKISTLEDKIRREERELSEDESELSQRKMEEWGTHAENILGLFGGRKSSRRLSTSLSRRRLTEKAKADVEESEEAIKDFEKQIAELEKEKILALEDVKQRWGDLANQIVEITVTPYKKDVQVDLFGVAWFPYFMVQTGQEILEIPGFQME